MHIKNTKLNNHYIKFNRTQWSSLNIFLSQNLSKKDILQLKITNKNFTLKELIDIYLPLSNLLNLNFSLKLDKKSMIKTLVNNKRKKIPYIIGILGSVAVGKSTTARLLQKLLSKYKEHKVVELITTDGFLYPNKILKKLGLMNKKGFPQSYDLQSLIKFIIDLKSGLPKVIAPVYSHVIYDILPYKYKIITQPDILILEGLNILQNNIDTLLLPSNIKYFSDFIDFSIYVDAPEIFIKSWYINRFLKFCKNAFKDPNSYFYYYSKFSKQEIIKFASNIWKKINLLNLKENILPTKTKSNLIITKGYDHLVKKIYLKNLL